MDMRKVEQQDPELEPHGCGGRGVNQGPRLKSVQELQRSSMGRRETGRSKLGERSGVLPRAQGQQAKAAPRCQPRGQLEAESWD